MPLLYKKHGHTAIMTLSRPQARNCWGQDYADGLIKHLDEANDDDEVRSVILTGDDLGQRPRKLGLRLARQASCASALSSLISSTMKR